MLQTRVVNIKTDSYDVLIARPSKWGNPFSHLKNSKAEFLVKTREDAIEMYRNWILSGEGRHLLNCLHELEGKKLGCWCFPKTCHGNILIELINKSKL